jgi:hypothetical protein
VNRPKKSGPVEPLIRAPSGRLKPTVRRHRFNMDSFSVWAHQLGEPGIVSKVDGYVPQTRHVDLREVGPLQETGPRLLEPALILLLPATA